MNYGLICAFCMSDYYNENLSAGRLRLVYDLAPPRIQQFLQAEIDFILGKIKQDEFILELGCGFGRLLKQLSKKSNNLTGIDISEENIKYARDIYLASKSYKLLNMNAASLRFPDDSFEKVLCIQNGISAFHIDPEVLISEAIRVTKPGGSLILSSYSDKFWTERLNWFELQAENGLIGEIDYNLTGNGLIVCKDGFKAITFSREDFEKLLSGGDYNFNISEVDNSLIFCEIIA